MLLSKIHWYTKKVEFPVIFILIILLALLVDISIYNNNKMVLANLESILQCVTGSLHRAIVNYCRACGSLGGSRSHTQWVVYQIYVNIIAA